MGPTGPSAGTQAPYFFFFFAAFFFAIVSPPSRSARVVRSSVSSDCKGVKK